MIRTSFVEFCGASTVLTFRADQFEVAESQPQSGGMRLGVGGSPRPVEERQESRESGDTFQVDSSVAAAAAPFHKNKQSGGFRPRLISSRRVAAGASATDESLRSYARFFFWHFAQMP
jgi:hypothetical protein